MNKACLSALILLRTASLCAQLPEGIPAEGLQGFWPFAGNASDYSGLGRHGTPHQVAPDKDRFGNPGHAYYFNGTSAFITTTYGGILGSHPRAVSFWALVKRNQVGGPAVSWGSNAQFPNAGGRFGCAFGSCYTCPDKGIYMGVTIELSDAGITFEPHEPVYDGRWHHYVFQFNKTYLKEVEVYQDGLLLTHEPYRFYQNCPVNTRRGNNLTFGALLDLHDTMCFKGQMDDIAIYDRVLSQEEIEALYHAPDPVSKGRPYTWLMASLGGILLLLWGVNRLIRLRVRALLKKEKERFQLEKKWFEQENRILKAQMDPHFIFNALNSIQQFIIVNENEKAQLYLSTFSQLIRMQLESNDSESILLSEELRILEKYLEIESLRFNNAFDYEITLAGSVQPGQTLIPCFMIQPFVENAIHHGLLPKLGYKSLDIVFEQPEAGTLLCMVEDNGIGRKSHAASPTAYKKRSLGVNFVQQRLHIMSKLEKKKYTVEIVDKADEAGHATGTKVIIKLPILNK